MLSNDNYADSQIVLELRKEESSGDRVKAEEGVSGRAYALVNEALWLQTLKWWGEFVLQCYLAFELSIVSKTLLNAHDRKVARP